MRAYRITLEVRVSNHTAQALYKKYGLENAGVRKRYYSDNGEDAIHNVERADHVARVPGEDCRAARRPY